MLPGCLKDGEREKKRGEMKGRRKEGDEEEGGQDKEGDFS